MVLKSLALLHFLPEKGEINETVPLRPIRPGISENGSFSRDKRRGWESESATELGVGRRRCQKRIFKVNVSDRKDRKEEEDQDRLERRT